MNKQIEIEDMATDIRLNMQIRPNPKEHPSHQLARLLVQDGYRKASEVAREIFEEIERLLDNHHSACHPIGAIEAYVYYEGGLGDEIAELKKKYESEDWE